MSRSSDDYWAAGGFDYLDLEGLGSFDLDQFCVDGCFGPAVWAEGFDAVRSTAELFGVEVLVVRHRVGDRPGDLARVTEVRDTRNPWHGEADHVVLGAGQPELLVDARAFDVPMWVARDDRCA